MRKRRSAAMNRRPSRNSRPEGPAGACWSLAGGKLAITPAMVANPAAPSANTTQVSLKAMMTPPRAGRNMRVPCQSMELRATALIMCARRMRLGKKDIRAGKSKPTMKAIVPAMARTCHTATVSLASRAARRARRHAVASDVAMSIARRSTRSATTPPASDAMMVGIEDAAPRNPSWRADPLNS